MPLLLSWYSENRRDLPWRESRDPYCILVSEIMLQQTRAETVIPYYHRFLAALPTIADLAGAQEPALYKLWEGLGYYSRVRNLCRAAKAVMSEHGGRIPADFEALLALPGVGRYTAGAVASIAFDLPYPAVDGNVLRVLARVMGDDTDVLSPAAKTAAERALAPVVPSPGAGDFTQSLIELGATVCTPGDSPACPDCPLRLLCIAAREGRVADLPVRIQRTRRRVEERAVLVIRRPADKRGVPRVLLRRRPPEGLLAGLCEFECVAAEAAETEAAIRAHVAELLAIDPGGLKLTPLPAAKHLFSHIEWRMQGFAVDLPEAPGPAPLPEGYFWSTPAELDGTHALPSAYAAYRPFAFA